MMQDKRYRSRGSANRNKGFFDQPSKQDKRFLLAGGGLILVLSAAIFAAKHIGGGSSASESVLASETETTEAVPLVEGTTVNGISIAGMTREEAKKTIMAQYPWHMTVSYGDETQDVANLAEQAIDALLDQVCAATAGQAYTLDFSDMKEAAETEAARLARKWDVKAEKSQLERYDATADKYVFSSATSGIAIDQSALATAIESAMTSGSFDAKLVATSHETSVDGDAKARYKTIAIFTTQTTDNAKRNKNVKLAADALNGTIVMPGEEFSFNKAVGPRTAEKGYQEAAAYNSGEVVQEVGGGVCQISSTLYRVAFQAGMQITFRRSHTFEPNYVTPGQDATISWDQPDFRFVNTSSDPICIRASYADRKATVAIYGVPVLEDGITWDLYSEKVEDTDIPEPTYIEDQTLAPGVEKVQKAGSKGSTWVTYKVVYKDGKEIERVKDHEKTYKGHAPVVRRNTSGVVLSPSETKATTAQTQAPTVDGMPDSYVPGKGSVQPESSAASTTKAQEKETAKESTAAKETSATKASSAAESSTAAEKTTAASKEEKTSAAEEPVVVPTPTTATPAGNDAGDEPVVQQEPGV